MAVPLRGAGRDRILVSLGLWALLLFHAGFNMWWLHVDNHPIASDGDGHIGNAYVIYERLVQDTRPLALVKTISKCFANYMQYPPLMHVLGAFVALVVGPNEDAVAFSSTIFFLLMMLGAYLLTATFLSRPQALFCAMVLSFTPKLFAASRYFCLDYFSAAFVPWILYTLVKTDRFSHRGAVIAFSLLAGLSGLAKPISIFFWGLPAAYVAAMALREVCVSRSASLPDRSRRRAVILNLGLSALVTPVVYLSWYLYHLKSLLAFYTATMGGAGTFGFFHDGFDPFSYAFLLINLAVFLPMFILALIGAFYVAFKKQLRDSPALLPVLSAIGGYILLTVFVNERDVRYSLPLVPAVSLLAAIALIEIPWKRMRIPGRVIFTLVLFAQFFGMTCTDYKDVVWKFESVGIDLPGIEYQHEGYMFTYMGSRKLSLFRPALLSVSFSFCPPYRGDHYVDRFYRAVANDLAIRPETERKVIAFQKLSTRGIAGIGNCFILGERVTRVRAPAEVRMTKSKIKTLMNLWQGANPANLLGALPVTDYILVRKKQLEDARAQAAFFYPYDFRIVDCFFDRGYGLHAVSGYYFVLARQTPSAQTLPAHIPADELAAFCGVVITQSDLPSRMETIAAAHPEDWYAQYLLGFVAERAAQLSVAEAAYRRAAALAPVPLARYKLSAFLIAKAEELNRQGDRMGAINALSDAGVLAGCGARLTVDQCGMPPVDLATLLFDLGRRSSAEQDIDHMLACYREASSISPHSPDRHAAGRELLNRAEALCMGQQAEKAVELLRKGEYIPPNSGETYNALAHALEQGGDREGAIQLCKSKLLGDPGRFQLYESLDAMLIALGDSARRIREWQDVINVRDDVSAYSHLGRAFEAVSDWQSALQAYKKGHELAPADGRFPGQIAWCLHQIEQAK